jgi:hypothetical protein
VLREPSFATILSHPTGAMQWTMLRPLNRNQTGEVCKSGRRREVAVGAGAGISQGEMVTECDRERSEVVERERRERRRKWCAPTQPMS